MAGAQAAWGLDVGVTSLKAIKLRRDGDLVTVEAFDVVEHDKFLSEPDVDRDLMIRQSLQKFLQRYPIRREQVFIGVPGSMTFARFVKLPPVEPKKVPEIVRFEAIQQIPFPLEQVNWDYHTFQSPESPDVEVGIFAMKKELVAQVLSNFQSLGMTVHGVQMSPLAIYNAAAFDGLTDDKGTIVIDMGAEHTDLIIMDQGRLWLRTINIGGNHFTDALGKSFKQSFSKAESLKRTAATSKYQKQIFQAMRPIFADLVAEIQRSIGHYNSSHRDSRLERIVGMGNPFKLPNLQKYLQQELKMEVVRLDNFRKMKLDGKLAAGFNDNTLGMGTAYGLAVQGLGMAPINSSLLPIEIARNMMWRRKMPWFIGAAACVVGAVTLAGVRIMLDKNAYAATTASPQYDANTKALSDELNLKSKFSAIPAAEYEANRQQIEQSINQAQSRTIWPALTLDILQALPQAKGATTQPAATQAAATQAAAGAATQPAGKRLIVLNAIIPGYSGALSTISSAGSPVNIVAPAAPAPENTDNGDNGDNPAPVAPVVPAGPAPGQIGPSNHGFVITLTGYSPNVAGLDPYEVPNQYIHSLMARAPLNNTDKPYYFSEFSLSGNTIPEPLPGAMPGAANGIQGPWGNNKGGYWDVFAPGIAGIRTDTRPLIPGSDPNAQVPFGQGDLGGPIDAFARDPQKGPQYMYDYYQFSIQFKVHVK